MSCTTKIILLAGVVKIWEMKSGRMLYEQTNSLIPAAKEENGLTPKHLLYDEEINSVGLVSTSHNILVYSLEKFECSKQVRTKIKSTKLLGVLTLC